MSARASHFCRIRSLATAALLCAAAALVPANAQVISNIAPDGTLGTAVTPIGGAAPRGGTAHVIDGGTLKSTNQFHSFDRFSIGTLDAAQFTGPAEVRNIVSRVTGLQSGPAPSQIDGHLTSLIPGANVFLMNPAGIMFGPNAQLEVSGAFHATTADYIKFGPDIFYADPARPSVLSFAEPSAFGFLSSNPAAIEINTLNLETLNILTGGLEQTLSFVGGPVTVGAADGTAPGYVFAPAGRVNLVSLASPGEAVSIPSPGDPTKFAGAGFNVSGAAQLGTVTIQGGSLVDGKDVFIRSGQLVIDNGAIAPQTLALFGLAPFAFGGVVDINVTGEVRISGSQLDPVTGLSPGISVFSGNPFGVPDTAGKVPDVSITANAVSITGLGEIRSTRAGPGDAGNVLISSDTVKVASGGSVVLLNMWEGPGGALTVQARDVSISGDGTPNRSGFEGFGSQGIFHPVYSQLAEVDGQLVPVFLLQGQELNRAMTSGDSGSINLNASGTLSVAGTAQIVTDSLNFGRGGDITISAGNISLIGAGAETGAIAAQSVLAGNSGSVNINASGTINVRDGFRITSSTVGAGSAGEVRITADGGISLDGADSRVVSVTVPQPADLQDALFMRNWGMPYSELATLLTGSPTSDLFTVMAAMNAAGVADISGPLAPGAGGLVTVRTPVLTLNAGTRIETSSGWDGNAGSIEANVGSLLLNAGGALKSTSGFQRLTGEAVIGSGAAGGILVNATDAISISGAGSIVSTTTFGDGNGGNVALNAGNRVNIADGGAVRADSGGTIGGAVVSGSGLGGNIVIAAGNEIVLDNGQITTQTLSADGGNITLTAPQVIRLQDSVISTSVKDDVGAGGNIFIDPQFVILNDSSIIANAFGGPGGNITIVAENFLASATSVIEASSALSTPGTIEVRSPENNVENNIAQLPAAFIDASALLRGLCTARRTGAPSSFVVAGRGGLPVDADGYLPSLSAEVAAGVASATGSTHADAVRITQPFLTAGLLFPNELHCLR